MNSGPLLEFAGFSVFTVTGDVNPPLVGLIVNCVTVASPWLVT
jgi:hypothetical protein